MKLVIVESPAKCSKIAGFLGPGYKVIASMGHIRTLEEQLEAVGIDRDFEPRMRFMTKEKGKAIAAIKEAAAGAEEVILAADDDREGEAIAYSIAVLLHLDPATTKRAVFHEITKPAVTSAVANPRLLDMNKVNAQMARAQLDMMVGFTISPLLWKHVERGLSAGRCQTPALRFVCDREDEIAAHTTSSSWGLEGNWSTGAVQIQGHMIDELEDEESATNYLEQVANSATVMAVTVRPWSEVAPLPLITSSLQQVASSLYRSAPKNTMRVAQRLYEAGHITYMRTDKAVLGLEAQAEARDLVATQFGPDYVGAAQVAAPKSKAGAQTTTKAETFTQAQEAHEAIRPTHFDVATLTGQEWTPLDVKIYQLIRVRAIQSVMSPVRGQSVQVRFQTADDEIGDFPWTSNARITTFQGWRIASATSVADDDADDEGVQADQKTWATLTGLTQGTELRYTELRAVPKLTKAAPRYTEATLVGTLERHGIGRPSTFAALMTAIEEKGYVEKKNIEGSKISLHTLARKPGQWPPIKTSIQRSVGGERDRLVPTDLGRRAIQFAVKHFDDLFAYKFTAAMECRLDAIAEGKEQGKTVLRDTWAAYKDRYETLVAGAANTKQQRDFGNGLKAIMTKKGPMLLREVSGQKKAEFFPWPVGATVETITDEMALAAATVNSLGTYDGQPIVKHDGKFGPYCAAGTLNVPWTPADTEETLQAKFIAKAASATIIGPFTFKVGQYGPYMYKTALQTKKFVNVPVSINPSKLTVREADEIYKAGLAAKESTPSGGRGGFRGRGR